MRTDTRMAVAAIGALVCLGAAWSLQTYRAREAAVPHVETCWDATVKSQVSHMLTSEFFSYAPEAFGRAREIAPDSPDVGKRLWVSIGQLHAVRDPDATGVACEAFVDIRFKRANDEFAHFDGQVVPYQVIRSEDSWLVTLQPAAVDDVLQQALERGAPE